MCTAPNNTDNCPQIVIRILLRNNLANIIQSTVTLQSDCLEDGYFHYPNPSATQPTASYYHIIPLWGFALSLPSFELKPAE